MAKLLIQKEILKEKKIWQKTNSVAYQLMQQHDCETSAGAGENQLISRAT